MRLDLLYLLPDRPLPSVIPDHDVAFFALGEADPPELWLACGALFAAWPRPALNNPHACPTLERDALSALAGRLFPALCSPHRHRTSREPRWRRYLQYRHSRSRALTAPHGPVSLPDPPTGNSHAGAGLVTHPERGRTRRHTCASPSNGGSFLTAFEDYSRSRTACTANPASAFIDREPFLCHMAISSQWMVHYLNAGMTESAEKRAEEAHAMAEFRRGISPAVTPPRSTHCTIGSASTTTRSIVRRQRTVVCWYSKRTPPRSFT